MGRIPLCSLVLSVALSACGGGGSAGSNPAGNGGSVSVAAAPTISPAGNFTSAQLVSIVDSVVGAAIYYTTDGSDPTTASRLYGNPISVSATTTIKAIAAAAGYANSAIATASIVINAAAAAPPLPTPAIAPNGGTFAGSQAVTLLDTNSAATLYYTLDGSTPTAASAVYTTPLTLASSGATTVKTLAVAPAYLNSSVATAIFTINTAPLPTPVIAPNGGTFAGSQAITLLDTNSAATLYYTLDGSTPTAASAVYTTPLTLASSGATTVKTIAVAPAYLNSSVATAIFTINTAPLPTPVIAPNGGASYGSQTVTLTDSNAAAAIYYTVDGTPPSAAATRYSASFTLAAAATVATTTVNAIAIATGAPNSAVAAATFTVNPAVSSSPAYTFKNVQIVGGGFVTGIFFHPSQQGLMYARTDVGGAYRWYNGVDTQWAPITDFIGRFNNGNDGGVESIGLDPSDSTRVYLAVGEYSAAFGTNGAILASTDRGNTFSAVPLPIKMGSNDTGRGAGERLMVDPLNGHHLYFGSRNNGLYESTDQALSWHPVTAFPVTGINTANLEDPEVGVIFEEFVAASGTASNGNTKTVYVGVSSSGTGTYMPLYVSNDGGVSFAAVPGQPTGYWPNKESLDSHGILYVTYGRYDTTPACVSPCYNTGPTYVNAGQVWKYVLPTASRPGVWSNITPPQTTPTGSGAYGYGSVTVDPQHTNVVMVTTMNKYYPPPYDDIFRSVDAGATWVNIGTNATRDASLSPWITFGAAAAGPGNWLNHLAVDPFDSNHVLYGDGQTAWATHDMTTADGVTTNATTTNHANATAWAIGALGIEETVVSALASPPAGPVSLLSSVGDIGGFTHTDVTVSPASGSWNTTGYGIDFAQSQPLMVARIGSLGGSGGVSTLASYSTDGGLTWLSLPSNPAGVTVGQGTLALAADGATLLWLPKDVGVAAAYSTNNGISWTGSTGAPTQVSTGGLLKVYSDRVNPKKFYIFNPNVSGGGTPIFVSTDGGHTFNSAGTPSTSGSAFVVSPAAEGDVWESAGNGLYHSTDSATTFSALSNVKVSYGIGFGKAAPGYTYPTLFLVGQTTADAAASPTAQCAANPANGFTTISNCIYRSVDGGATWSRINDLKHQWSRSGLIIGDPRVFGRFYLATPGRGIIQGDSPN